MKKISAIIIGVFMLCSCFELYGGGTDVSFDEDITQWMSPYFKGDTILLSTNNGVDSFCVNYMTDYDDMDYREHKTTYLYSDAYGRYECVLIHNGTRMNVIVQVNKRKDGAVRMSVMLGNGYNYDISDRRNPDKHNSIKDTVIIDDNNLEYGECGHNENDFEYIKIGKTEGIIEYRLRDGTVYTKR